ncbi:hypothetical protein KA013_05020 [Patescibacteria group bacterium]|nr:hypothetical protein [Patescibacteria group bacterium]
MCYLKEALGRFDLSARNCSPDNEAVYKIIKITNEFSIELEQGIYWTKILISTIEEDEECDHQKLSILRNTLAQLYAKNENHAESQIARERARAEG